MSDKNKENNNVRETQVFSALGNCRPIDSLEKVFSEMELITAFIETLRDTTLERHGADLWIDEVVIRVGLYARHMENVIGQAYKIGWRGK